MIIPTSVHLDTMPTPSEFRGQFPVKAVTREAEKTSGNLGSRLLRQHCHAGKNRNQFDFTRALS